jgi:hypothetical protein
MNEGENYAQGGARGDASSGMLPGGLSVTSVTRGLQEISLEISSNFGRALTRMGKSGETDGSAGEFVSKTPFFITSKQQQGIFFGFGASGAFADGWQQLSVGLGTVISVAWATGSIDIPNRQRIDPAEEMTEKVIKSPARKSLKPNPLDRRVIY